MKKSLCFIFIFIIFLSGCAQVGRTGEGPGGILSSAGNGSIDSNGNSDVQYSSAPDGIVIRNKETLDKVREMADLDEEEFMAFAIAAYPNLTLMGEKLNITKQDFMDFLKLLDSIMVPALPNAGINGMTYYPDSESPVIDLWYKSELGEIYGFHFYFNRPPVEEFIKHATGKVPELIYQQESSRIKVYNAIEKDIQDINHTRFLMDIDGCYVYAGYRNDERDVSKMEYSEIYSGLMLGRIEDLSWTA